MLPTQNEWHRRNLKVLLDITNYTVTKNEFNGSGPVETKVTKLSITVCLLFDFVLYIIAFVNIITPPHDQSYGKKNWFLLEQPNRFSGQLLNLSSPETRCGYAMVCHKIQ